MYKEELLQRIKKTRLIATVKEAKHLEKVLESGISAVFLLTGNIGVIKNYVDLYKSHNLSVFLHVEKIGGLSCDYPGLEYVANHIRPTGIISTKNSVIKLAPKLNLITVQRLFLIDSDAFWQGLKSIAETKPDIVEIMPARIPEIIREVSKQTETPIITGGLLENREQMLAALQNGALAVSTGKPELWKGELLSEFI